MRIFDKLSARWQARQDRKLLQTPLEVAENEVLNRAERRLAIRSSKSALGPPSHLRSTKPLYRKYRVVRLATHMRRPLQRTWRWQRRLGAAK